MSKFLMGLVVLVISFSAQAADKASTKPATSGTVNVTLTKDNTLVMDTYFESETVANLAQKAKELDAKLKSKEPLFLVINSGGGSIDAGIELIENLNNLNREVHTITLFSASMGFQTVQGVHGKRLVVPNGTLMSHKARGGFYGEFPGQFDSRYSYYLRRVTRLDAVAVARTNGKHTMKSYAALIENEFWCDGKECVGQGFADMVANVGCGDSLKGTHETIYDRFVYMGHVIEIVDIFSDCPVITGSLSWQVYIDAEPLFEQYKQKPLVNVDKNDYYYGKKINKSALADITLETAENIKKLITKKMDARNSSSTNSKDIRKY